MDSDKAGNDFSRMAGVNVNVLELSEACREDANVREIEDLFDKEDLEKYDLSGKSFNSAAIFAQKLDSIYDELHDDTKRNFRLLLGYIDDSVKGLKCRKVCERRSG